MQVVFFNPGGIVAQVKLLRACPQKT